MLCVQSTLNAFTAVHARPVGAVVKDESYLKTHGNSNSAWRPVPGYVYLIRIEKQLNVAGRYTTFNKRDIELFASYKRMKREWEWIRETKTE